MSETLLEAFAVQNFLVPGIPPMWIRDGLVEAVWDADRMCYAVRVSDAESSRYWARYTGSARLCRSFWRDVLELPLSVEFERGLRSVEP